MGSAGHKIAGDLWGMENLGRVIGSLENKMANGLLIDWPEGEGIRSHGRGDDDAMMMLIRVKC